MYRRQMTSCHVEHRVCLLYNRVSTSILHVLVVEINEDHPKEKKAIYSELVMAREAVINIHVLPETQMQAESEKAL